jgi:hypothetical protein
VDNQRRFDVCAEIGGRTGARTETREGSNMQTAEQDKGKKKGRPPLEITVDGRPFTLDQPETTPNQILELAGLDPTAHYLVRVEGRHQESYEGRGDDPIRVHPGETFVSVSTGPTPVS